jgi:hypothetical protein
MNLTTDRRRPDDQGGVLMTVYRCGAASSQQGGRVRTHRFGRRSLPALAAAIVLLVGGVASSSAQTPSTGTLVEFDYTLTNVPPNTFPAVIYSTGVVGSLGGSISLESGAMKEVDFLSNAWSVLPTGTATLNATISDSRLVSGPIVTGTAHVPGGATLTVLVGGNEQPIRLTNGKFSVPTGLGRLGSQPPSGGKRVIACRGNAHTCHARINLAGGARNREIVIRLTNTDLSLQSVKASPRRERAAYSLTRGHFAHGGTEYIVTLNAARSSPRGSGLSLTFA